MVSSAFEKILFVFPETRYPSGQPPLGIAHLSSVARAAGAEVRLCDMSWSRNPFGDLRRQLCEFSPQMVGISMVTPQLSAVLEASGLVREAAPGAALVIGGPHATVMPLETLERTGADLVYSGEAEEAFGRVLRTGSWEGVPGACYRKDGEPVLEEGLLLTQDLDDLPPADRSIFDMETYFANWYSMDRVDPSLRGTTVMGTRGCPFRCTFCQPTLSAIFGRKMRRRSPGSLGDELEQLRERWAIDAFMFEDSTFIVDHGWVHGICDVLTERSLGLLWCCNIRADLLTDDLLDHMYEAGLRKVNIGVESASQRVLDEIYDKQITVNGVERALAMCKKRGIFVQGYFMLGAPGETLEEIRRTIDFAARNPFDDALFDITTPFPHTTLWERTRHLVRRDLTEFDCFQNCVYELEGISPEQIERIKRRAFWRFYLHPSRILRTMWTAASPRSLRRTLVKARRV
jgi:anaerobic magnesium-protoporphyrin IX monomethyl ester cyclase